MAKTEKLVYDVTAIDLLNAKEKPKGVVFTEWDILFEENVSTKKRDQIIARLLNKILKFKVKDNTITTSLKYHNFKSETNDNLYVLRVYRDFKIQPALKKSPVPKSSARSANNVAATVDLGPIRTPGPPVPQLPAGVLSITDSVGLGEDSSG